MPIYEFQCKECGHRFEELVAMGNRGEGLYCPKCHASQITKQISAFNSRTANNATGCQQAEQCADQGINPHSCAGGCGCQLR